jgi:2-methylcitrate dehydratase PrpD
VLAAELAMRGVRGDREVFDGPYGYYQAFYRGEYDRGKLVSDLGRRYETDRVSLKPWPTIRHLHMLITAVSDAMRENALSFEDVDHVTAFVGKINLGRCGPTRLGMVPRHRIDLLGNLPFALAATLRHGGPSLQLYRDTALADDVIRNAVPKVRWEYDKQLDGPWTFEPGRIALVTRSGKTITQTCDAALGNPDRPMSTAQRHQKLFAGAANAAPPVSETRARDIIAAVEGLEDMADVSTLAGLLA